MERQKHGFEYGTTKSLGKKEKNDKFYTKPEVAAQLLQELDVLSYSLIIEPSAGNGSFSNFIPNCIALDIEPENEKITRQDFFTYEPQQGNILVIGNPPFGEQSTLAIQFFNHAAKFADTIAFILPKSFRKTSIQNKLNLFFWLVKEMEVPKNSFLLQEQEYDVPCVFQIWKKKEKQREKIVFPKESEYFSFTKEKDRADFRVQRVGGNAGKAFLDKNGASSSNYYLQNISDFSTEKLIELLNRVEYESINDTVGPKSLPKGEFIYYSSKEIENEG